MEDLNEVTEALEETKKKMPIVLVGTKCDLEDKREVSFEEGQRWAEVNGCAFCERSSKDPTFGPMEWIFEYLALDYARRTLSITTEDGKKCIVQ